MCSAARRGWSGEARSSRRRRSGEARSCRLTRAGRAREARAAWLTVTAVVNAGLLVWAVRRGEVGGRAVEWSLAAFCIAVAARHDGIVRGAFVLGRLVRSYRLHQLTYHLGQLHRAMAIAGMAWLAVAVALAVPSNPVARMASGAVLAIGVVMARTARDRVRQSRHNRFESVHRLGGWTALGILVIIIPVAAARSLPPGSGPAGLLRQPSVLLLAVLVMLVAHPWLGVRRRSAEFLAVTSEVVVVALPGRHSLGEFVRVSRDGHEWHSFAVATTGDEGAGPVLPRHTARRGLDRAARQGRRERARPRPAVGAQDARLRLHVPRAGLPPGAHGGDRGGNRAGAAVPAGQPAGAVRVPVDRPEPPRGHGHRPGRPGAGRRVGHAHRHVRRAARRRGVRRRGGAAVRCRVRRQQRRGAGRVARACESLGVPWYGPTFDS